MNCSPGPCGVPTVFMVVFCTFVMISALAMAILMVVAWWKICRKAGLSGWLALLMFVPVVSIALPLIVAFVDWPVLRELRELKQARTTGGQPQA